MLARAESGHCILWGVPEYNPELVASDEAKVAWFQGKVYIYLLPPVDQLVLLGKVCR